LNDDDYVGSDYDDDYRISGVLNDDMRR